MTKLTRDEIKAIRKRAQRAAAKQRRADARAKIDEAISQAYETYKKIKTNLKENPLSIPPILSKREVHFTDKRGREKHYLEIETTSKKQ